MALAPLVAIQVFAGEERIGAPRLGLRRDDLVNVFPAYPNAQQAGFTLSTTLSETARQVTSLRAQAICAEGFAQELIVPVDLITRRGAPPPRPPDPPRQDLSHPDLPHDDKAQPAGPAGVPPLSLPRQDPVYRLVAEFDVGPDVFAAAPGLAAPSEMPALPSLGLPALGLPSVGTPPMQSVPPPATRRPRDPRRVIHYFCDAASVSVDGEVAVDGWAVCAIGIASAEVWLDDQRLGEAQLGLPREDVGDEYPSIPMARYAGFHFLSHVAQPADGEHRLRIVAAQRPG